ncbi:MAG: YhcH/YjgK/YiaL family protein [Prevotella sp.]|nr:YhcH/YjgK/YiaL family protein [Prevotella sp.]
MRRLTTLLLVAVLTLGATAQTSREARDWFAAGGWANGFNKAKADCSLNVQTFYEQYHKNPNQWYNLFRWLQETDLLAIPKGKHPIPGSDLVASVEDSENGPIEKRGTESHRKKIDFQLVVKGTEGFALLDHESSTVKIPYDEKKDVMRYNFVSEKTNFFDLEAGHFVIFFPTDWHIAKLNNKRKDGDQTIRVIVIKVDYKE